LDSDLSTATSSPVYAVAYLDFGAAGYDFGVISLDGAPILNLMTGTLTGVFQPPHVTGTVPAGTQADLYLQVYDSLGNSSNFVVIRITF